MKIRLKLKKCYLLKDFFPDFPVFPDGKWAIFPVSRREIENPGNVQLYSRVNMYVVLHNGIFSAAIVQNMSLRIGLLETNIGCML